MKTWTRLLVAVALGSAMPLVATLAQTPGSAPADADVVVTAVGVRSDQGGRLLFALFRGRDGWPKLERAALTQTVPADAESITVTFVGVAPDTTYAVEVIHDKNANGRLDMRTFPFPKPKEGAGVSRNHTRLGPPAYDKARFTLADSSVAQRIVMRY